MAEDHDIRL